MAIFAQPWIPFALFAIIGLAGYNVCAKVGGGNLPPVMFASIMYVTGFTAMLPLFFWFMHGKSLSYLKELPLVPVLFAMGAGLVVIIVDVSISSMFNRQAPVGIGMASISVGCLALTTMIGMAVFKEQISVINGAGIFLALISIPLMFYNAK